MGQHKIDVKIMSDKPLTLFSFMYTIHVTIKF